MRPADRRPCHGIGGRLPLALAGCSGLLTARKAPPPTEYRLTPELSGDLPRPTGC